jgi:hypothetical protein
MATREFVYTRSLPGRPEAVITVLRRGATLPAAQPEQIVEASHAKWVAHGDARAEAKSLFRLVSRGETVEQMRELILVDEKTEGFLLDCARANPGEGTYVRNALSFRRAVWREFERLLDSTGW